MKKWGVFLLGCLTGIILTFATAIIISNSSSEELVGLTLFEQPGECLSTKTLEVLQAIDNNHALANEVEWDSLLKSYIPTGLLVLVTNDEGECYYDQQLIKIPKGKCMRQIGIYKYLSKMEVEKTVPVVKLMTK